MSQKAHKFLKCLTLLWHRVIRSNLDIGQILQKFLLIVQDQCAWIYLGCLGVIRIRLQFLIGFLKFFCLMIANLHGITIPVDHLIRIMEIKILLSQYPCQKIRNILRTHTKSKTKQKYSLSLDRCLCQPVIDKRCQFRWCRIHWFRCTSLMKRLNHDVSVNILRYFIIGFFESCTFINISFQVISKRYQFHFFI